MEIKRINAMREVAFLAEQHGFNDADLFAVAVKNNEIQLPLNEYQSNCIAICAEQFELVNRAFNGDVEANKTLDAQEKQWRINYGLSY